MSKFKKLLEISKFVYNDKYIDTTGCNYKGRTLKRFLIRTSKNKLTKEEELMLKSKDLFFVKRYLKNKNNA